MMNLKACFCSQIDIFVSVVQVNSSAVDTFYFERVYETKQSVGMNFGCDFTMIISAKTTRLAIPVFQVFKECLQKYLLTLK